MIRNEQGFFTLIELLVVAVIIMLAFWWFYGGGAPGTQTMTSPLSGTEYEGGPLVGALQESKEVACVSNLGQVRQAIQVFRQDNEQNPANLADLKLPRESVVCPAVPHQPYAYDPATGTVHCVHPGHERL